MNERIIRAAVMQVIDDHRYRLYEGTTDSSQRSSNGVTVDFANAQRLEFANAVISRVRDLQPHAQRSFSVCKAEHAHFTAAEAWEVVGVVLSDPDNYFKGEAACPATIEKAQNATGLANEATKDAPPNVDAFNATAAAILAASMIKPTEAASAHRRAAEAYRPHTTPEEMDSALGHLQELGLISQEAQEAETEQQSRQTS